MCVKILTFHSYKRFQCVLLDPNVDDFAYPSHSFAVYVCVRVSLYLVDYNNKIESVVVFAVAAAK